MIYDDFVKKITSLDSSNKFEKSELVNNPYNRFYDLYNPRGVEFDFNGGALFMIPYGKIEKVTKEYVAIKADYVFAVCDGDPYFVKSKKVYTCCHGTKEPEIELVADSFEKFLDMAMKGAN